MCLNKDVVWVRLKYDQLVKDSGMAILFRIGRKQIWIPKRKIRNLAPLSSFRGAVETKAEFLENKGFNSNYYTPSMTIEKNIPEKIEPIQDNTIQALLK